MNPVPFEGRRGLAHLLGATLLALTLAACGGGGDDSPEPAASGDHITGTLGSEVKAATQYAITYQYWDRGDPDEEAPPSDMIDLIAFNGADPVRFDYDFYWLINNLPATAGTHVCGSGSDLGVTLELSHPSEDSPDSWRANEVDGACSVTVTRITDQAIEGSFSATLVPSDGGEPRQVTNASFHITRGFIQGSVDGAPMLRAMHRTVGTLSGTEGDQREAIEASAYDASGGSLGYWVIWQLPAAPGTYQCGQGAGQHDVWVYWENHGSEESAEAGRHAGSSCTVTVTRVANGFIEGTFSATIVDGEGWHEVDEDFWTFDTITKTYSVTGGSFRMPMNSAT